MRTHGAFICARYSTENQKEDSIEVQAEKCTVWCNAHDIPVLGLYADMAVSGMKDTRPQLERMLTDLRAGMADMVVMYDQSRVFRKMSAWFGFREEMERLGVTVVSVTQPVIGGDLRDPMNFLSEGAMALFNQIWSLQSRQKIIEKKNFMARQGLHNGGKPPLGYDVNGQKLVVNQTEAGIVRRIFSEYASGRSYKQIIDGLNADGIRTKRGNPFGTNSLHDMLKNEKYIGTLVYGGHPFRADGSRNTHADEADNAIRLESAVPAIIDKDLFMEVQARMAVNKKAQAGRPAEKREYPLKGKVFCGECGAALCVAISQEKYFYYQCSAKKRTHECGLPPISVDALESQVLQYMRSLLGDPKNQERLMAVVKEQANSCQSIAAVQMKALRAQEKDLSRKLETAVDALLTCPSQTIKDRIAKLEAERLTAQTEIKRLQHALKASALPEERLSELFQAVLATDNPETRTAILSYVTRVEVGKQEIRVWTIFDTPPDGDKPTKNSIRLDDMRVIARDASGVPQRAWVSPQPLVIRTAGVFPCIFPCNFSA